MVKRIVKCQMYIEFFFETRGSPPLNKTVIAIETKGASYALSDGIVIMPFNTQSNTETHTQNDPLNKRMKGKLKVYQKKSGKANSTRVKVNTTLDTVFAK